MIDTWEEKVDDAGTSTWPCGCKTWKMGDILHLAPCSDPKCRFSWGLMDEAKKLGKRIRRATLQ